MNISIEFAIFLFIFAGIGILVVILFISAILNSGQPSENKEIKYLELNDNFVSSCKELAFYLWLSQQPERRINITRQFCADTKYSASYLKMYSMVSSDSRVFTSFNVDREMVEQCSAETLSKLTDIRPFEKDWLQQIRSKINGQFKKWLEAIVVEAIEIGSNEYNTQQHEVCYFMSETVIIEC